MVIGAEVVIIGVIAGTILIAILFNALDEWWKKKKGVVFVK